MRGWRLRGMAVRTIFVASLNCLHISDEEKIGKPWRDDELDAIIADYFSMLDDELSGRVLCEGAA